MLVYALANFKDKKRPVYTSVQAKPMLTELPRAADCRKRTARSITAVPLRNVRAWFIMLEVDEMAA